MKRWPRSWLRGPSVSTVALGEDADRQLLSSIAEAGHGRFYETNDPSNVPQIFTKETMEATKSAIKEDLYGTVQVGDHPILAGYHGSDLPFTLGYVMTEAKPTAQLLLAVETGDPLLAVGHTVSAPAWLTLATLVKSGAASGSLGAAAASFGLKQFAEDIAEKQHRGIARRHACDGERLALRHSAYGTGRRAAQRNSLVRQAGSLTKTGERNRSRFGKWGWDDMKLQCPL